VFQKRAISQLCAIAGHFMRPFQPQKPLRSL